MTLTTGEIAEKVGGTLIGAADVVIASVAEVATADDRSLVLGFDKEYRDKLKGSSAGAFLVTAEVPGLSRPQIVVKNGRLALARVLAALYPQHVPAVESIHPTAVVHPSVVKGKAIEVGPYAVIEEGVVLGDHVVIGAHTFIGQQVQIGDDTVIGPQVMLYRDTVIGRRVRIDMGAAVGIEGFGFVQHEGKNVKVPQVGRVIIEDDVELFGLNSIARSTIGETRIGAGTKIDCLVHIAHNVTIGKNCIIVAQCGCAGNAVLGDNVILAGQVGVVDHTSVGSNTMVLARSVVSKDIPAGSVVAGFPARDHREDKRTQVHINKLGELFDRVKELERKMPGAPL